MIAEALKRTVLLMRTDLVPETPDTELLAALVGTRAVLSADQATVSTYAGQCALTTAAMLMARSGHQVFLDFPDAPLIGHQPPLEGSSLVEALLEVGSDLIPDYGFSQGRPADADVAFAFGSAEPTAAVVAYRVAATDWGARLLDPSDAADWPADRNPLGALAAAAMVAGEAFKSAMRRLQNRAASPMFDDWYAPTIEADIALADNFELPADLSEFDVVSGGAITNGLLYTLLRVPEAVGHGRVMDDDRSALSNINRNVLLRRSRLDALKVDDLASYQARLKLTGIDIRYGQDPSADPELRPYVLVGVDHIASRWELQRAQPRWLGIGATANFMVQISEHRPGNACAGCVHPHGNELGPDIPTVAFVSFWGGLLLAVEFLKARAGCELARSLQRLFCTLRPETWAATTLPTSLNPECPIGHRLEAAE